MGSLWTCPRLAENRLLSALPREDRERLFPLMRTVRLKRTQTIQMSGEPIGAVYFPVTAVLSVVSILANGSSIGVGTIGNDGVVGLSALFGAESAPFDMRVQIPGIALRIAVCLLYEDAHRPGPVEDLLLRHSQALFDQVAQGMACGHHHSVVQRLASWLLTVRDRVETDCLSLTQEFLGQMLGTGSPRVSLAEAELAQLGLIRHDRGSITIADRPGLETTACECYRSVRDEYDRLLGYLS